MSTRFDEEQARRGEGPNMVRQIVTFAKIQIFYSAQA